MSELVMFIGSVVVGIFLVCLLGPAAIALGERLAYWVRYL